MHFLKIAVICCCCSALCAVGRIEQVVNVAPVWSGHPVRFCLLTSGGHQFVAFYNGSRRMTVASRRLNQAKWEFVELYEKVGWDSHNYITMTVDDNGFLHLSGNMHCVPLVYFRTSKPYDIQSLKRIKGMVGHEENRCTYPAFMRGPGKELIFTYRDGGSGNGNQIYNIYDLKSKKWRRLLDKPLLSGEGRMNAYLRGPVQDRDGVFHLCWVWRDTPDCATNHDLSYACSRDLVHWKTSSGASLELPITIKTGEIIDPVPPGGGMINGNTVIGFDTKNRPIVSYHKFDGNGWTQIYNARLEDGKWKIYKTSSWTYRWEFHGGGSIPFEVHVGRVEVDSKGRLTQDYGNSHHGSGTWILDKETLKPIGKLQRQSLYPMEIKRVHSKRKGMGVRFAGDLGHSPEAGVKYFLRWETLGRNRDRPHKGEPPKPSMLQVYRVKVSH